MAAILSHMSEFQATQKITYWHTHTVCRQHLEIVSIKMVMMITVTMVLSQVMNYDDMQAEHVMHANISVYACICVYTHSAVATALIAT